MSPDPGGREPRILSWSARRFFLRTTGGRISLAAVIGFLALMLAVSPLLFVMALFGVAFGLMVLGLFSFARRKAEAERGEQTACAAYARARGLTYAADRDLGTATELLRRGSNPAHSRWASNVMSGFIPGDIPIMLSHFTIKYGDTTNAVERHFTLALFELKTPAPLPRITCATETMLSNLRMISADMRPIELESSGFRERFGLFLAEDDEDGEAWVRRLFSPRFVLDIEGIRVLEFTFEIEGRTLCVYVPGRLSSPQLLDSHAKLGAGIAGRVVDELAGIAARPFSPPPPPPPPPPA